MSTISLWSLPLPNKAASWGPNEQIQKERKKSIVMNELFALPEFSYPR